MFESYGTQQRSKSQNKPVKVSRSGGLEIWYEGFYVEGKGVRRIVHSAVRSLGLENTAPQDGSAAKDRAKQKGFSA